MENKIKEEIVEDDKFIYHYHIDDEGKRSLFRFTNKEELKMLQEMWQEMYKDKTYLQMMMEQIEKPKTIKNSIHVKYSYE